MHTLVLPCLLTKSDNTIVTFQSSILTSKNTSLRLFLVSFSRKMFFLPISSILTGKSTNHTYIASVYSLNKANAPYFIFITPITATFTFHAVLSHSKHESCFSITLKLLNLLGGMFFFVCVLFFAV